MSKQQMAGRVLGLLFATTIFSTPVMAQTYGRNPYQSNVEVNWGVLDRLGPSHTVPGLIRGQEYQGTRTATYRRSQHPFAHPVSPGCCGLQPPPAHYPKSYVNPTLMHVQPVPVASRAPIHLNRPLGAHDAPPAKPPVHVMAEKAAPVSAPVSVVAAPVPVVEAAPLVAAVAPEPEPETTPAPTVAETTPPAQPPIEAPAVEEVAEAPILKESEERGINDNGIFSSAERPGVVPPVVAPAIAAVEKPKKKGFFESLFSFGEADTAPQAAAPNEPLVVFDSSDTPAEGDAHVTEEEDVAVVKYTPENGDDVPQSLDDLFKSTTTSEGPSKDLAGEDLAGVAADQPETVEDVVKKVTDAVGPEEEDMTHEGSHEPAHEGIPEVAKSAAPAPVIPAPAVKEAAHDTLIKVIDTPIEKVAVEEPPLPEITADEVAEEVAAEKRDVIASLTPQPMLSMPGKQVLIFPGSSTQLTEGNKSLLDEVVMKLDKEPGLRVQLFAYAAAPEGDSGANQARRISLSRALAIRAYLLGKEVLTTRIDVRALGSQSGDGPANRVDILYAQR